MFGLVQLTFRALFGSAEWVRSGPARGSSSIFLHLLWSQDDAQLRRIRATMDRGFGPADGEAVVVGSTSRSKLGCACVCVCHANSIMVRYDGQIASVPPHLPQKSAAGARWEQAFAESGLAFKLSSRLALSNWSRRSDHQRVRREFGQVLWESLLHQQHGEAGDWQQEYQPPQVYWAPEDHPMAFGGRSGARR